MGSNSGGLLMNGLRFDIAKCKPNCQTQYQSFLLDYFFKIFINYIVIEVHIIQAQLSVHNM
jgi:hypothetical protein